MPSPFPGMDPYLEGYLWPDLHAALAGRLRQQLAPLLRPNSTARLALDPVEDPTPEADLGILYPDVEVPLTRAGALPRTPAPGTNAPATTPATLTIPIVQPAEVRLTSVEVRDAASNELVTSIEILSPVNKRDPGLAQYRGKRQRLIAAGVHLLELDLLRRGARPLAHPRLAAAQYVIALTRAHAGRTEVWPLTIREPLPIVPVPLRAPDADVALDLGAALAAVYDEAAYDLSIDYGAPPPPPELSADDRRWLSERLPGT